MFISMNRVMIGSLQPPARQNLRGLTIAHNLLPTMYCVLREFVISVNSLAYFVCCVQSYWLKSNYP